MSRRKIGRASVSFSDLRVLACGVALEQYPRDDTLWRGLSRLDVDKLIDLRRIQDYLDIYQHNLNKDRRRSGHAFHRIGRKSYTHYSSFKYLVSILQTIRKEKIDIVFVFPRNHLLTICLSLLKFYHGAKVYFDPWGSIYSVAVSVEGGFMVAKNWLAELLSLKLADQLIPFTPEYARHYKEFYKIRADKFSVVPLGVQNILFKEPVRVVHACSPEVHQPKRVLYWGTFLIQHGLDVIINAAEELKDEEVEFIFCGRGKGEAAVKEQVRAKRLNNVVLKGFVPTTKELIHFVDSADACLGFFKDTSDAALMTPNKVLQGMARGKPVITLWSKQQEDLYQTKDNPFPPLILINPDSKSLAKAIMEVVEDPQKGKKIGDAARLAVKRLHGVEAVTSALKESLEKAFK